MIYYRKTVFGRGPKLTAVQLVNDPKKSKLMGFAAKKWAEGTFSPVNYAKSLVDFTEMISKTSSILDGLESFLSLLAIGL